MSQLTDQIDTPIFECILPSTGEKIKFRPYVVSEERALMMALESEDNAAMLNTLDSVVRSCIIFPKKLPRLSTFDVEYLFVQIRIKSVDENSILNFTCNGCKEQVPLSIPLKTVYVDKGKSIGTEIKLDDTLAVSMQYPTILDITEDADDQRHAIAACLKAVYKGNTVLDASGFTIEETTEFFDKLFPHQFKKVLEFFDNIPVTKINVEWSCPTCKHAHKQVLTGVNSFF